MAYVMKKGFSQSTWSPWISSDMATHEPTSAATVAVKKADLELQQRQALGDDDDIVVGTRGRLGAAKEKRGHWTILKAS